MAGVSRSGNVNFFSIFRFLLTRSRAANDTDSDIPSSCTIKSDTTATAQADLDDYSGCKTLVGNLTISGSSIVSAALANVEELKGSLVINNASNLNDFHADSLKKISNSLSLQKLYVLSAASFGSLEEVDTIDFVTLPAISTFTTNLKSANYIIISDTALETVNAFSSLQEVAVFNVNNNKGLTNLKSDLETVSNALEFSSNGNDANVTFDSLKWANNITLRDVDSASFKILQSVNSSLGLINNSISEIDLSHLKTVGGSFSVVSNEELTKVDCKNLTTVGGGFVVANNTKLRLIDGFSKLSSVGGALVATGNFTELDLSSLKSVKGGAQIDTSSGNFSCDALKTLQSKGAIQGDSFVCKNGASSTSIKLSSTSGSQSSTGSASATASDDSDSSSSATATGSSSSSSRGAAPVDFAPAGSILGVFAAVAAALL